jgi:hypothetical protein
MPDDVATVTRSTPAAPAVWVDMGCRYERADPMVSTRRERDDGGRSGQVGVEADLDVWEGLGHAFFFDPECRSPGRCTT